MAKRKRRKTDGGDFNDPLKDYSPTEYDDELEESLSEGQLSQMRSTPVETTGPETTVEQAVKTMAEKDIGSLLITEPDGKLLGIVSERDVQRRVAMQWDRVKDKPVREVMTPQPTVVYETDTPARALHLMSVHSIRHVPIVDVDQRVVGILGPRRVTAYLQQYFPDRK